ncbi:hypothetical protein AHAS_Ahas18G0181700 [Arachis hypogaea]
MGYFPPPQNDSSHYSNGYWEYHQEFTDSEQPNQWGYASENDQGNFKRYYPPPQDNLCNYPHDQNQKVFDSSYSTYQKASSLEQTFNSFMENCKTPPLNFPCQNFPSLEYTST